MMADNQKALPSRKKRFNAPVFLVCLSVVSGRIFLFFPIMTLFYMEEIGLRPESVLLIQVIFAVTTVCLEIPTGTLADRIGTKRILLIARPITIFSLLMSYFATSFLHLAVASALAGIASACNSGASSAFLYEILEKQGREDRFGKIQGSIAFYTLTILSIVSLPIGIFFSEDMRHLYVLSLFPQILSFIALLPITKQERQSRPAGLSLNSFAMLINLIKRPSLFLLIITAGLLAALFEIANQLYQPFMLKEGVSRSAMGLLFVVIMLSHALGAKLSDLLSRKTREKRLILLVPLVPILLFAALLPSYGLWSVVLYGMISFTNGVGHPLYTHSILKRTSYGRATALSCVSFVKGSIFTLIFFFLLPYVGEVPLELTFPLMGLYFLIPLSLGFVFASKMKNGKERKV